MSALHDATHRTSRPLHHATQGTTLGLVLPRTYSGQDCSIAGALEVIGDRWTLLVLREVFLRNRRFEDIQRRLGIARNVLTARLGRLVEDGVLERVAYQERPERF